MQLADVVILTAAEGEDEAVRAVREGALTDWREGPGPGTFSVWNCLFRSSGDHLRIILARAHEQRAEPAATMATALLAEYNPRCLAMCGVCAGRPGWTELGDVIIADRVYRYDAGTREDGRLVRHDVTTYNLNAAWKQAAEGFAVPVTAPWLPDRPYTLAAQSQWLLAELHAGRDPEKSPERAARCRDWKDVLEHLWQQGALAENTLDLTAAGKAQIGRILLQHHGALPERPSLKVHVGPLGTGNNLVTDDGIWDDVTVQQSHVLGLDMEASAIGLVGHVWKVPEIVVTKGVMDFAERKRARYFRSFAARAAAEVLLALLRGLLAPRFDRHATALDLSLSVDGNELRVWAGNSGTHVIRDIAISALPEDEFQSRLPRVVETGRKVSEWVYPYLGGWFYATIPQLDPDRGYMIAKAELDPRDYTVIEFEVSWNDHEGRRRKSYGSADARNDGKVILKPRVLPE